MAGDTERTRLARLVRQAFENLGTTGHVAEGTVLALALALRAVPPDEGVHLVTTLAGQEADRLQDALRHMSRAQLPDAPNEPCQG
jgi:hypothetical protein